MVMLLFVVTACSCKNTKGKNTTAAYDTSTYSVTFKVDVAEILKDLSDNSQDASFLKAVAAAVKAEEANDSDFVDLFYMAWREHEESGMLARVFATYNLREEIAPYAVDEQVLQVVKQEAEARVSNIFSILRNRIDRFATSDQCLNIQRVSPSTILVEVADIKDTDRFCKLLLSRGRVEFWETFDNISSGSDPGFFELLATANEIIKEESYINSVTASEDLSIESQYPLFSILNPSVDQEGNLYRTPVIGRSHVKDTAMVNELLAIPQVRNIFPYNVHFAWGAKPTADDTYYELIALKVTSRDGKAPLDGSVIADAKAQKNQWGREVFMTMNREGSKVWARLTADNIGRQIAIVVDGRVYSCPTVNNEITSGLSIISGNFTKEETEDLAVILKSGELPAPIRIVSEER